MREFCPVLFVARERLQFMTEAPGLFFRGECVDTHAQPRPFSPDTVRYFENASSSRGKAEGESE